MMIVINSMMMMMMWIMNVRIVSLLKLGMRSLFVMGVWLMPRMSIVMRPWVGLCPQKR